MKREWIHNQVKGLIEFCSSNNVFDICNYLNIAVKKVDRNYLLLNNKDSIYFRNFNNDELILLRNDLPYEYEKFVLAHEVGHAILHPEVTQACFDRKLLNIGKYEKEANLFALILLDIDIDPIENEGLSLEQILAKYYLPSDLDF